jgi:hypothetical protein
MDVLSRTLLQPAAQQLERVQCYEILGYVLGVGILLGKGRDDGDDGDDLELVAARAVMHLLMSVARSPPAIDHVRDGVASDRLD